MATNQQGQVWYDEQGRFVVDPEAAHHAMRTMTRLQRENKIAKDDLKIKDAVLKNVIQDKEEVKQKLHSEEKARCDAQVGYHAMENQKMWAERHHADAVQDLGKKEEYINYVNVQLEEYKTRNLSLERDNREYKRNLQQIEEEKQALEIKHAKLEAESRESKRIQHDLQIKSSCMEQELLNLKESARALKMEKESLHKKLQENKQVLDTEKNRWESSMSQKSANLMQKDLSLRRDEDTIKELRKEKSNVEKELEFTQKNLKNVHETLQNETKQTILLEGEKRRLEEENETLHRNMEKEKRKTAQLQEENNKLANDKMRVMQKSEELEKRCLKLENERKFLTEKSNEKDVENTQLRTAMMQKEKQHKQALEETKSHKEQIEKEKNLLEIHLDDRTRECDELTQKLKEEQLLVQTKDQKIENLNCTLQSVTKASNQQKSEVNKLQGKISDLESEKRHMADQSRAQQIDCENANGEVNKKNEEIADLQKGIKLYREKDKLKTEKIEDLETTVAKVVINHINFLLLGK